ncbi:CGNR zinc finger domain-containing protein [Georgenia deserti]|uniref:CGNR zinc finger domain-containing protein n=1 Tax=Georgenia deserti TaxID=2093781 RepID=A0ABW4L3N3_9MICO
MVRTRGSGSGGAPARNGDWLFLADALCADFANTLRDRWRPTARETLIEPRDLTAWVVRAGITSEAHPCSPADLARARELRDAVIATLEQRAGVPEVAVVNAATTAAPRRELTAAANGVQVSAGAAGDVGAGLGLVAADLIDLVAAGRLPQVKECAHARCGLLYVDRSRGARRRWCSMQRCGNRAKVQRHARRTGDGADG